MPAQELDDLAKRDTGSVMRWRFRALGIEVFVTAIFHKGRSNIGNGKHKIGGAGQYRAARHAVVGGVLWILHDNEAALAAYRR